MDAALKAKYEKLSTYLAGKQPLAVAFSAGVDSTFLLKAAHDVLGDGVIAVTAKPYSFPDREYAEAEGSETVVICAKVEAELSELDDEERDMFLEELGIEESGLEKLIRSSYALLDLISFITTGEDETRAWTIKRGTLAPQAAGRIHTAAPRPSPMTN